MSNRPAVGEGLTGTREDWLAVWKAAAQVRGYSYEELDHRAGLTHKYFSRLACGDIGQPTAETIDKINRALELEVDVKMLGSDSLRGVV
jgi:transcriptional regulator with XRE-family HTH domain